ncbi:hypothetical protein [Halorhabdus sp. CUG00001]|uniref:hypothetical protein n=1 Tax=Halorhabdus sp. CUG00001 TaxID=2600297 RepID=UPI00131BCF0C|nr:hypothetical protein [Halorhabdus sp. CUG00001]
MNNSSHPPTRRGVLSTIGAAIVGTIAGCSSSSGQRAPTSADGGRTTEYASPTATTTVDRSGTSTVADAESDEYNYDEPLSAFEQLLEKEFLVPVTSIDVVDDRVQLTYVARSEHGHEVAAGIEAIVVSFIRVYKHGWDVTAVDATMMDRHDPDTEMGRWRLEARWVENTLDGERTRTKLLERTLGSYHGDPLKQDDEHHHDGKTTSGHHHDDETDTHHHDE